MWNGIGTKPTKPCSISQRLNMMVEKGHTSQVRPFFCADARRRDLRPSPLCLSVFQSYSRSGFCLPPAIMIEKIPAGLSPAGIFIVLQNNYLWLSIRSTPSRVAAPRADRPAKEVGLLARRIVYPHFEDRFQNPVGETIGIDFGQQELFFAASAQVGGQFAAPEFPVFVEMFPRRPLLWRRSDRKLLSTVYKCSMYSYTSLKARCSELLLRRFL